MPLNGGFIEMADAIIFHTEDAVRKRKIELITQIKSQAKIYKMNFSLIFSIIFGLAIATLISGKSVDYPQEQGKSIIFALVLF